MFIGPCIIAIVEEWKTNLMSLAILFHFLCAQHVSDINISIIRSLRLCCWITTSVVVFSVCCVLEIWCGWVWVVSVLQAEAQACFSLQLQCWMAVSNRHVYRYTSGLFWDRINWKVICSNRIPVSIIVSWFLCSVSVNNACRKAMQWVFACYDLKWILKMSSAAAGAWRKFLGKSPETKYRGMMHLFRTV